MVDTSLTHSVTFLPSLELSNGMTAGIGPDQPWNRPLGGFLGTPGKYNPYGGNNLWRPQRIGCMRSFPGYGNAPSQTDLFGQSAYYLYFLYNPNQVIDTLSTNISAMPSLAAITQGAKNGVSVIAGGGLSSHSVQWTLFFDRSYDMVYGSDQSALQNRGVLGDVAALYNIMGAFVTGGTTAVMFPVQLMFGKTSDGLIWGFTGYITGATITYSLFAQNMIPFRCEIDLQMMAMFVSEVLPSGDTTAASELGAGNPLITGLAPVTPTGGVTNPYNFLNIQGTQTLGS